jgi:uncharacterized YccA/Bax inhibitor family protein
VNSSNPIFNQERFAEHAQDWSSSSVMTLDGTINKAGLLFIILLATAGFPWVLYARGAEGQALVLTMLGFGGALLFGIGGAFFPRYSGFVAPCYALFAGLLVGGISAIANANAYGVVAQAVLITFSIMAVMLFCYKTGIIQATQGFIRGVMIATAGIMLVYLANIGLMFFGMKVPFLHEGGAIGIGISLFIIVIAALNFIIDFAFIERGAASGAPKYMEFYAAFGLLVTLVWLYIEVLRLLGHLRR